MGTSFGFFLSDMTLWIQVHGDVCVNSATYKIISSNLPLWEATSIEVMSLPQYSVASLLPYVCGTSSRGKMHREKLCMNNILIYLLCSF